MLNSEIQLLKDAQTLLAEAQTAVIHAQYYDLAHRLEGLMIRIGTVIIGHHETCTRHNHSDCHAVYLSKQTQASSNEGQKSK